MKQIISMLIICLTALFAVYFVMNGNQTNSVAKVIETRRSIRNYKDKAVEREKLQRLAELGVMAPSAMNNQAWEIRIVDSKEWIDGCSKAYLAAVEGTGKADYLLKDPNFKNIFRNASALIFVGAPDDLFSGVNIGMLGENIMLAAVEMGLGSCCLGSVVPMFAEPALADYLQSLGFSNDYKLCYALAIGYPAEEPEATPRDLSKIQFVK